MKEKKADSFNSANKIRCGINKFFREEKHTMSKRFLSLLLSLVLCFSLMPPAAFAEDTETKSAAVLERQDADPSAEREETDTSAEEQKQQKTEALPSVQSNEGNGIALQLSGYVAKIGTMQYQTLDAAFAAANNQANATIELLKDVELGEGVNT